MDNKEFLIKFPRKKDSEDLKSKGVFVFDACALLSIYSFTDKEREEFLLIIKNITKKDRIWLPYQFLKEFEIHRLEKIQEQLDAYTKFKNIVDLQFNTIKSDEKINNFTNHKFLAKFKKKYNKDLEDFHKKIVGDLNEAKIKHPDWRVEDPVKKALMKCFDGKIGNQYLEEDERYKEFLSSRDERYLKFIPPGYMDNDKNKTDISKEKRFGDLLAWFQILDYAKIKKIPIAIVTEDRKEDWWNKNNSKFFGPRKELMYEIYEYAGVPLFMFNMEDFVKYIKEDLGESVKDTLLERVKRVEINENKDDESINDDQNIASSLPEIDQNVSDQLINNQIPDTEINNDNLK